LSSDRRRQRLAWRSNVPADRTCLEIKGDLMSDSREPDADKMPEDEELHEPSTEKDPGEEPRDADVEPDEADHEAVGIGVIGSSDSDDDPAAEQQTPPQAAAAQAAKSDSAPPTDAVTDEVRRDAVGIEDSDDSTE
jgi:hypothetical protein